MNNSFTDYVNSKICVNLYGDGSRNSKLRAEAIYCDKHESCTLWQRGLCAKITSCLSPSCPMGSKNSYGYYTKQAKAYDKLYKETKADPVYHAVQYPMNMILETVDDKVLLHLPYTYHKYDIEKDFFKLENPGFGSDIIAIPIDKFSINIIKRICDFRPRNWSYGEIMDYASKILPDFILRLSQLFPDKYKELIAIDSKYDLAPNYVGKRARLSTVNRNLTYHKKNYGDFRFEGNEIVFDNYHSAFTPFDGKCSLRIELNDDMEIEITDNNQVVDGTVIL